MWTKKVRRKGLYLALPVLGVLSSSLAHAAKVEKAIGAGMAFYSGADTSYVSPELSPQITFAANILSSRTFNIVNRFEFGLLTGGKNFAGSLGTYLAYLGAYELGLKMNFGKEDLQPFIEAGPLIGLFAATVSSQPASGSKNQTAFKYGFTAGTGFDWLKAGKRGEGKGWGLGFYYFQYMKSPGKFEFPEKALMAKGVKFELRIILAPLF